jgi:hypothetical protein
MYQLKLMKSFLFPLCDNEKIWENVTDGVGNQHLSPSSPTPVLGLLIPIIKTKLRGRSPQANYTDRATAAYR